MYRVLVVDDELEIAKALRRLFRNCYTVEIAGSGEEALAQLDTFRPDVVISDFRMPGMNGTTLLANVKSRLPQAVCILASGFSDPGGLDDCPYVRFEKPWDDQELTAKVGQLVAAHEPKAA